MGGDGENGMICGHTCLSAVTAKKKSVMTVLKMLLNLKLKRKADERKKK